MCIRDRFINKKKIYIEVDIEAQIAYEQNALLLPCCLSTFTTAFHLHHQIQYHAQYNIYVSLKVLGHLLQHLDAAVPEHLALQHGVMQLSRSLHVVIHVGHVDIASQYSLP